MVWTLILSNFFSLFPPSKNQLDDVATILVFCLSNYELAVSIAVVAAVAVVLGVFWACFLEYPDPEEIFFSILK